MRGWRVTGNACGRWGYLGGLAIVAMADGGYSKGWGQGAQQGAPGQGALAGAL